MTATIMVRPLGQQWQTIGTLAHRGVWHEGLELVSDQFGPKTASFTLKRPARALLPDLLARTPVAISVNGSRVWAGRVKDTPETGGRGRQVGVECVGGQAKLDDGQYERVYVHTKLSDWRDSRTFLAQQLNSWTQLWNVQTDNGAITLGLTNGSAVPAGTAGGVTLDLGPNSTAKRIVITFDCASAGGNIRLFARGNNVADAATVGEDVIVVGVVGAATNATFAGTFTTARRYVHLFLTDNGAPFTAADFFLKLKSVQVFADTAYESGNLSVLTADTIILDALARKTVGLNADRSGIGAPGFPFPDFAPDTPRTVRDYITAANAPSNWRFKIDEELRPLFRPRPTAPVIAVGNWPGCQSDQGSSNSDEGIVTEVIIRGRGPDGSPISVTRTQTGTIIDRQGDLNTKTLDTSFMLNTALANQLGDTYLAAHRASPFKGQVVVAAGGARRVIGGLPIHPAQLLLLTGELARRSDLIDPDTGAVGRAITIDQVTYRDADQTSTVDLDNTRNDFEALMERLGLLVPS